MCSERSGSNFITKLLNGHSNICGPSTKHIVNPVARNLFRYNVLSDEKNWEELLGDIERLFNVGFSFWKSEFDRAHLKRTVAPGDVGALIRTIFLDEAHAHGKEHISIKENHVYEFFPFLLQEFPDARYIYLTRDPRDMALSWKKNLDHPGGVIQAAKQWRQDQVQSLKNHWLLARQDKAFQLRYEDLIMDPERYCQNMCAFLGLPYEADMLEFHKDKFTKQNAQSVAAWKNLAKPVMSDNSRKYREELSERETRAIETICFYEMKQLGYEPDWIKKEGDWLEDSALNEIAKGEESVGHNPADGVIANMRAKKKFYRRHAGQHHGIQAPAARVPEAGSTVGH